MNSIFSHIQKTYSEYEYWKTLSNSDKVDFLFDMWIVQSQSVKMIDLSSFFESVKEQYNEQQAELRAEQGLDSESIESFEFDPNAPDRVDVMIDDSNIMIESNNLKALKAVTYKFIESGYILQRDVVMEKLFRRDKITRYLRIFKIINQVPDLCTN